jgi:hypothetical protein
MASLRNHLAGIVPPFESRLRGASLAPKILLIMDCGTNCHMFTVHTAQSDVRDKGSPHTLRCARSGQSGVMARLPGQSLCLHYLYTIFTSRLRKESRRERNKTFFLRRRCYPFIA